MTQDQSLRAALLVIVSLALTIVGMCVGCLWGLCARIVPYDLALTSLWVLAWSVIGGLQGACVAPAWALAKGGDLRTWATWVLLCGGLSSSAIAMTLFILLGASASAAISLATGLVLMTVAPACSYLLGRREIAPPLPASM